MATPPTRGTATPPRTAIVEDLERHLRETMVAFGTALEREAERCRRAVAHALWDTGRRLAIFGARMSEGPA